MLIIEHRVNKIEELNAVPKENGVEIDVRHDNRNGTLYLNHDPGTGDDLEEYLKKFNHAFIVFNIKEVGIENRCIQLAKKYNIPKSNYFLLDVEFPYLYRASRKDGVREIAVRYSEAEPIEMALAQKNLVDWVWIDTNTKLPLNIQTGKLLMENFKTCLVSPDRWGRPEDIKRYIEKIKEINFRLDAVMVGKEYVDFWK
ncbi:MAG: hypothetical protein HYT12_01880 [Candidatus Liptonbacteria bacterium]|nr:hypothetical protein [Candidatus Liptonbacteria bacterium]